MSKKANANARSAKYKAREKSSKSKGRSIASTVGEDNFRTPSGPNTHNDPNWYIYDDTMFRGVISMPTLEFKGTRIPWKQNGTPIGSGEYDYLGAPTVAAMYMNPAASYTGSGFWNSPINVAARKMYAELSASNAKTSNYAPQDVAALILALGQIIAIANYLKRAYGISNYFNFYNRAIPDAIMAAHGSNDDAKKELWRTSLSNLRARLNQVIAKIDSIHFPGSLNHFQKCAYIYSNIFVDREDEMPTYLLMIPESTWILDEDSYEEGSILKTKTVTFDVSQDDPYQTIFAQVTLLDNMVNAILTSSTFNYIFSDVINLANRNVISSDWIHVDPVSIDYVVEPLYSEQFNWQFMNATILGEPNGETLGLEDTPSNDVYPDVRSNCIKYSPTFLGTSIDQAIRSKRNLPVRIPNTNMSDEEFVELLAYYNVFNVDWDSESPADSTAKVLGISDYYGVRFSVYTGINVDTDSADSFRSNGPAITGNIQAAFRRAIADVSKVATIVHAPLMEIVSPVTSDQAEALVWIMSKLGTFTIPDQRAIYNLREQIYLGLFKF